MKVHKTISLFVLIMFVILGCTKNEENKGDEEITIPTDEQAKVELQIEGYTSFGNTPFEITILDSNGGVVETIENLSFIPESLDLEDGEYSLLLKSIRPEIITTDVNLYNGISEKFVVSGSGNLSVRITIEKEAFKGWVEVTNVPLGLRNGATSFIIDSVIYVGFGYDDSNMRLNDWWSYSINENVWTRLDDFPGEGRTSLTSFKIGSKGYICLGYTESSENMNIPLNELWEFDSEAKIWSQKADFIGVFRNSPVAFVVEGKGYIGSGSRNGNTILSDFYRYDPLVNEWSQVTDVIGDPTYGFGSFSLEGKGHLLGGVIDTIDGEERTNQHFVYIPSDDSWVELSPAPGEQKLEGVGFVINDVGYYGLGNIGINNPGTDLWKYDVAQDTWVEVSMFPGQRRFTSVFGSNNEMGYFGLGSGGGNEPDDFYLYYPED